MNSVCNPIRSKFLVSRNITYPEPGCHPDAVRFLESSDRCNSDIRGVRGKSSKPVQVPCECLEGVEQLTTSTRGKGS